MLIMTEFTGHKYPTILELHLGISCRLNCSFCYRGEKKYNSRHKLLSNECLKKLINDFAKLGGRELYLSGGLEPFSDYLTVCHVLLLAHSAGIKIRVYTNGTEPALQKGWVQELLVCTTERIRFSVHARTVNKYSEITRIRNAKTIITLVEDNILSLLEQRVEDGPLIGIGFVVNEDNITELIDAAQFWSKFGVDFMDVRFDVLAVNKQNDKLQNQLNTFQSLVKSNIFFPMQVDMGDFKQGKPILSKWCSSPFRKIVVDLFGFVWPCCLLAQPGKRPSWACLGNLADQCYEEIINNVSKQFPRRHCSICTPFEIKQNNKINLLEYSESLSAVHGIS